MRGMSGRSITKLRVVPPPLCVTMKVRATASLWSVDAEPNLLKDGVFVEPPPPRGESYAFSVPVTSIYSLMVTAPTFSSWCACIRITVPLVRTDDCCSDGAITINITKGSLSTLHFHDDESRSMQFSRSSPNAPAWGGEGT